MRILVYLVVAGLAMAALDYLFYEQNRGLLGLIFVSGAIVVVISELRRASRRPK